MCIHTTHPKKVIGEKVDLRRGLVALSQEKARHRGGVPTQMSGTVIGVYGLWSSAELSQKRREDIL